MVFDGVCMFCFFQSQLLGSLQCQSDPNLRTRNESGPDPPDSHPPRLGFRWHVAGSWAPHLVRRLSELNALGGDWLTWFPKLAPIYRRYVSTKTSMSSYAVLDLWPTIGASETPPLHDIACVPLTAWPDFVAMVVLVMRMC